ncbi:FAD:protein FMN transferase [Amycolatopsis orientalis]|uniref:FAD:protein FMN transferase n=1 Tax=Amycolatopsis orientalis TaxID=31958 RepID=UPI0003A3949C|nr:FAD:protein FMN transferase [Amycolatopsis orientalis]
MTAADRRHRSWSEPIMGTQISLHLRGPLAGVDPVVAAVFADLRKADALFSTYRPDSEVSAIRRRALSPARAHPWVAEVVALCDEARERTEGYFDAWLPGGFDPSGIVKGWAAECAAARLARLPGVDYYLNAGGDITGRAAEGPPWRVGVQDPACPHAFLAVVPLRDGGIATSGSAERGPHILDPHTGDPAGELLALTVTGPTLLWADVFATAAFARGGTDVERWVAARAPGYRVAAVVRAART